MNPLLSLDGENVIIRMLGKSTHLADLDVDQFYRFLLDDIMKVFSSHPVHGDQEVSYFLCPRWEQGNPSKREVFINGPERRKLGTVSITEHKSIYSYHDGHVYDRSFRLSFQGVHLLNAKEFYSTYWMLQDRNDYQQENPQAKRTGYKSVERSVERR